MSRVHLATIRSHLPQSTGTDSFTISVNPSPTKPEDLQAASNTTYDVRINGTEATSVSRTTEATDSHTFETVEAFTTPVPDMTSHEANHNWFRNVTAVANNVGTTTSVEFLNSTFADERNQPTDPTIENTSTTSDVEVQVTTEPEDLQPASNATYKDIINSTVATGFNGATEASDNHTGETVEAFTTPVPDMTSHEANHSLLRNVTAVANNDGTTTSVEFLNSTFVDERNQSTYPTIENTSTTSDVEVQFTTEPEDIQPASNATYDDRIYSTEATGFNGATEAADNHTGETVEAFTTPVPDMTSHEANHSLLRNMTAAANNDGTTTSVEFLNSTFADGRNQSTDPTIGNTSTTTDVEVQVTTEPGTSRLSTTAESETETSNGTTLLKTTIVPSMNSTGTETSNDEVTVT